VHNLTTTRRERIGDQRAMQRHDTARAHDRRAPFRGERHQLVERLMEFWSAHVVGVARKLSLRQPDGEHRLVDGGDRLTRDVEILDAALGNVRRAPHD